jgi:hypothetical protein
MNAVKEANKIVDNYEAWKRVDVKATVKQWFLNVLGYLLIEIFVTLIVIGTVTLIRM